jgi:hypothetical protein
MVKAGNTMWNETVKANCSLASVSASKSSIGAAPGYVMATMRTACGNEVVELPELFWWFPSPIHWAWVGLG